MASTPLMPTPQRWMFWSTRDSILRDVPSITAIAETVIAIPLYFFIAIHYETYLLFFVGVAAAPFVLLRSDESVKLGVEWFAWWELNVWKGRYLFPKARWLIFLLVAIASAIAGLITHQLVQPRLEDALSANPLWQAFSTWWLSIMVAGTVGGAAAVAVGGAVALPIVGVGAFAFAAVAASILTVGVAVAMALLGVEPHAVLKNGSFVVFMFLVSFIPIWFGIALGIFAVSLLVRIGATTRFLLRGVASLPRNFRRLTLCTSPLQEPELVPGLVPGSTEFTLSGVLRTFHADRLSADRIKKLFALAFYPLAIPIWFVPGWIYRIALKSTSWFWWGLAIIGGPPKHSNNPQWFYEQVRNTYLGQATLIVAGISLAAFALRNIWHSVTDFGFPENPFLTVVGYAFVLDWSTTPWQLLGLFGSVLSLAILLWIDWAYRKHVVAERTGDIQLQAAARLELLRIERLSRIRSISIIVYWGVVSFHAVLFLNTLHNWFAPPEVVQGWADWLYGAYSPR